MTIMATEKTVEVILAETEGTAPATVEPEPEPWDKFSGGHMLHGSQGSVPAMTRDLPENMTTLRAPEVRTTVQTFPSQAGHGLT